MGTIAKEDNKKRVAYSAEKYQKRKKALKARKEEYILTARELQKVILESGLYGKLSPKLRKFVDNNCRLSCQYIRASLFNKLFGDEVVPGAKITLVEAMSRTLKGKDAIDQIIKEALAKGYDIEFIDNKKEPLRSEYLVKGVPSYN